MGSLPFFVEASISIKEEAVRGWCKRIKIVSRSKQTSFREFSKEFKNRERWLITLGRLIKDGIADIGWT